MFSKCCGGKLAGPGKAKHMRSQGRGRRACVHRRTRFTRRADCLQIRGNYDCFLSCSLQIVPAVVIADCCNRAGMGQTPGRKGVASSVYFYGFRTCVNLILHTSTFEEIVAAGSTSRNFPGKAEEKEKEQQRRGRESSKWFKKTRHIAAGPGVA